MRKRIPAALLCAAIACAEAIAATGPVIYPAKGQSPRQLDQDKYECHDWARAQSGFDPTQPSQSVQPSQSNQARPPAGPFAGAATGAAIAELSHHDVGRGAAIGVLAGSVAAKARQQQAAQAGQQQAAQQAAREQQKATYSRGFGACMEARGYVLR